MARLYRQCAGNGSRRRDPPVAGSGRASLRTTGRKDQGPGSNPTGIDRPTASGAGSIVDRAPTAAFAAGGCQKALRTGGRVDRGGRRAAAILCQRAGVRARQPAHRPQAISESKGGGQEREPQARQVAELAGHPSEPYRSERRSYQKNPARLAFLHSRTASTPSGWISTFKAAPTHLVSPSATGICRPATQNGASRQFFPTECELFHICPWKYPAWCTSPDGVSRFQYPGLARSLTVYYVDGLVFFAL